jgi:hypothetical protein
VLSSLGTCAPNLGQAELVDCPGLTVARLAAALDGGRALPRLRLLWLGEPSFGPKDVLQQRGLPVGELECLMWCRTSGGEPKSFAAVRQLGRFVLAPAPPPSKAGYVQPGVW